MTCPRCSNELRSQRQEGVEIDVCPQCGGVWLDRGELGRLTSAENAYYGDDDDDDDDDGDGGGLLGLGGGDDDDDDDPRQRGRGGRRRKRGFLQNLMDNLGDLGG